MPTTKRRKPSPRKPKGAPHKPADAGPAVSPIVRMWRAGEAPPWIDAELAAHLPQQGAGHAGAIGSWCQQVMDTLVSVIASTGSVTIACGLAGVTHGTYLEWCARGREDQRAWEMAAREGRDPGAPTEWHLFARAMTWAAAAWAGGHVAALEQLVQEPDTPAAVKAGTRQWLLSRLAAGMGERVEHDHRVSVDDVKEAAETMRERLDQIRERAAKRVPS